MKNEYNREENIVTKPDFIPPYDYQETSSRTEHLKKDSVKGPKRTILGLANMIFGD